MASDLRAIAQALATTDHAAVSVRVRRLVERLAANPEGVEATRHILGFVHLKLGEVDGHTLRLHLWTVPRLPAAEPDWPIHTHLWHIESHVLVGDVENHTFNINSSPGSELQLYDVIYEGGHSRRVATGHSVSCQPSGRDRWESGQRYAIPRGTFHTTAVPDDVFAATLMHAGQPSGDPVQVVGQRNGLPEYRYERRVLPPADASQFLRELAAQLR